MEIDVKSNLKNYSIMMIHKNPCFSIMFGDMRHAFIPAQVIQSPDSLLAHMPFAHLKKTMQLKELVFLHQVHGNDGMVIPSHEQARKSQPFSIDGDYLITNQRNIGLAVATADCLPVIIYDPVNHASAAIHAGWRGAVKGVVLHAITHMKELYGTDVSAIKVYYGPSAKACCYQVGDEVITALEQFRYGMQTIMQSAGASYFDVAQLVTLQLGELGVKKHQIKTDYHQCTMCNESFCSFRRQKGAAARQYTVICLQ